MAENGPPSGTVYRDLIRTAVRVELARAGISASEVARRIGMPAATFGRRMTGEVSFTAEDIVAVAAEIGIPTATLLEDVESAVRAVAGAAS